MTSEQKSDQELYDEWQTAWRSADFSTLPPHAWALYKAGFHFGGKHVPPQAHAEILRIMKESDWSGEISWLALGNVLEGFVNEDRVLFKAAQDAWISHRLALSLALLLDANDRKGNEVRLYQKTRYWVKGLPTTIKKVNNTVAELIRVWGGNERAEQWVTLLSLDKEWNDKALSLDSRTPANMTAIIRFALFGEPLHGAAEQVELPSCGLDFNN